VFLEKIRAYGDPRLFALRDLADRFANSAQPLVPERVFISGNTGGQGGEVSIAQTLLSLLVSERSGLDIASAAPAAPAKQKEAS